MEQDKSSDEDEVTSTQSYDTALTLAKNLQFFLVSKGKEKAVEDQQNVISVLENAKVSAIITNATHTSMMDFMNNT